MSKSLIIIVLLIITVIAFCIYLQNKLPPGVESKGNETTVAIISLWTAIVSLLGTVLAFILKIMEIRTTKQSKQ